MAYRSDTRSCTVSQNWEWVQVSGSGGSKSVTKTGVSVRTYQDYGWDGSWTPASSVMLASGQGSYSYSDGDGYSGSISLQSWSYDYPPPPPSGTGTWGETRRQTGGGTATYSGTVNKTASYQWSASGNPSHNASSSISYDDGTYAGTLYLDSVSGSPSPPSYNGSSIGESASTSTSGMAYYSGDVPLKQTAPSSPTNFRITSQDATSVNLAWNSASGADTYSVEVYVKGTTTNPVSQNYGITGLTKYITGLTSGQSYDIKLYASNGAGNSIPVWMYDVKIGHARPTNWTFTTLVSSQSTNPNTIYTNTIPLIIMNHTDWNNFTKRINDFRKFKNLSDYPFSTVSATHLLTQEIYDEAINAITSMKSITEVNGFYSKLINLRDILNSVN
jgi:hypothetical protein